MADKYLQWANSPLGKKLFPVLGLPVPVILRRENDNAHHQIQGSCLFGRSNGNLYGENIATALNSTEMELLNEVAENQRIDALVFDASGIESTEQSEQLYQFFHRHIRQLNRCGRIIVVGQRPESSPDSGKAALQRGLLGFVKSIAKEIGRKGAAANLIAVGQRGDNHIVASLRFFLSGGSAFVDGQQITVAEPAHSFDASWERPLEDKAAVVTGAARGIGAAISQVLARDGARVVGIDVPQSEQDLSAGMQAINGLALPLDITDPRAGEALISFCYEKAGGLDVVVHNAGITRDKTLGRMTPEQWNVLMNVNLGSVQHLNSEILKSDLLDNGGRIINVASISGIAGNVGQSNYSFAKAAVVGMTESMAIPCAERGITVNAVAPGFIETNMTKVIPFMTRQLGRRLTSLSQGGLPQDVAETIAFFASPQAASVNGNVVRVCGQSLLGA